MWSVAGLSPRRPGFIPRSFHVRFMVDTVALVQVNLSVLLFFRQYHSTSAPHSQSLASTILPVPHTHSHSPVPFHQCPTLTVTRQYHSTSAPHSCLMYQQLSLPSPSLSVLLKLISIFCFILFPPFTTIYKNFVGTNRSTSPHFIYYCYYLAPTCFGILAILMELTPGFH